ncbi:MAG TPA: Rid family detoxifying hydrolase [Candidatus Limnocylindrales bacterium]|nr:Rid family detoxifying hydrolase [Candidatus Limnocylindrales bacterium]
MKKAVLTDGAPRPAGPYSQGIVATGELLFTAGQVPIDPATGEVNGTTIEEQTARVLDNLGAVLAAAGCSFADVVRVNVYLADMADWAGMNATYERYFPDPRPTRTTVGAGLGAFRIEIDLVAAVPADG